MALRDWKRFRSKSFDRMRIVQWESDGGNSKVSVSPFYYGRRKNSWAFYATSVSHARKGYPYNKVDISKAEALKRAKAYMKKFKR